MPNCYIMLVVLKESNEILFYGSSQLPITDSQIPSLHEPGKDPTSLKDYHIIKYECEEYISSRKLRETILYKEGLVSCSDPELLSKLKEVTTYTNPEEELNFTNESKDVKNTAALEIKKQWKEQYDFSIKQKELQSSLKPKMRIGQSLKRD